MSAPVAKRVIKGIAAHGLGQVLTIVVQIVGVPLFLSKWGVVRYGEWLVLTALPGYLTISDLGFGPTAANEMTMLAGAGREDEVQRIYRSVWVLILALSAVVLVVACGLALALPFDAWLGLRSFTHGEAVLTTLFLIGQIVLGQQGSVIGAGYRAGGFYATGLWAGDSLKFLEFLALVLIVLGGGGPVLLTGTVLAIRALSYVVQYAYLRRLVPWLSLGFAGASKELLRPLVGPALAFSALPLAQATTLQGSILVTKAVAGPTAVVIYSATRTITRFVLQVVSMVTNSTWPEFSRALGARDLDLARRLHRRACQSGVWLALIGCALMGFVGPFLFHRWTKNAVPFRADVFAIMLGAVVLNGLWSVSYAVPVSVNRHQKVTYAYLGAALFGLVASALLGSAFGLVGVALGLVPVELITIAVVLPLSMGLLEDRSGYLELMRPPFRWLLGRLRRRKRVPA